MRGVLTGKVAIVTGAASGIGRASALLFAREGAAVVVADVAPSLAETAEAIEREQGRVVALRADAGSEADVIALVERASATFGGLDIFFANAGITGGALGGYFDATPEIWMETLRVNLVGAFLAVKHGAPAIQERGGGAILCTASVAGLRAGALFGLQGGRHQPRADRGAGVGRHRCAGQRDLSRPDRDEHDPLRL
jgi:NAD(P)-dependent dehydrogenase (short-subunit alcohol dehydrogenase family)